MEKNPLILILFREYLFISFNVHQLVTSITPQSRKAVWVLFECVWIGGDLCKLARKQKLNATL